MVRCVSEQGNKEDECSALLLHNLPLVAENNPHACSRG